MGLTYLGIDVHPYLESLANHNYSNILGKIEADLLRWSKSNIPCSLQARISIIKMDILPRLDFFSSMIPLPTPPKYWNRIHSMISRFIWKKKKPRVELSTLQRGSTEGGLSVPNFEFYALAFSLRPLAVWFNKSTQTCWRGIEERIVHPYRLEDIVHSSISQKQAKKDFGPLIAHLIESWKGALKLSRTTTKCPY